MKKIQKNSVKRNVVALMLAFVTMFVSIGGNMIVASASEELEGNSEDAVVEAVDLAEAFGEEFVEEQEGYSRSTRAVTNDYRSWAQQDSRWGTLTLGSGGPTVAKSGCLIVAITKLIIQCGLKSDSEFTPATLVNWLNSNDGFAGGGSLYWAKPAQCVSGFSLKNYNLVSSGSYDIDTYKSQIISWIKQGYHMVISMKSNGHWVAIDEAKTLATGEIYIMDSAYTNGDNADITFKERYGTTFNRIAAYTGGTTPSGSTNENPTAEVTRIFGNTRYETAIKTADALKAELGIEKFENVVIASGEDFADALAGSYLATKKDAPILLIKNSKATAVKEYINNNVKASGTVYVLGGTAAVSEEAVAGLEENYNVVRLEGATRYETNLEILKEAGVANEDIIVCTGTEFADSLSASAIERPILLVKSSLREAQKEYLSTLSGNKYYVIGGISAVSDSLKNQIAAYGTTERIGGATRYETSTLVAEKFITDPEEVVFAYAKNYPDGLCGGVLAASKNAPLILTAPNNIDEAYDYVTAENIEKGVVLGGTTLISDDNIKDIFFGATITVWE